MYQLAVSVFVCKQDINSLVIVFVHHDCELSRVCHGLVFIRVSCGPCALANISERSRSSEAVRQDIPSLSYRLPLLLRHTYRDPSSPRPLPPPLTFLLPCFLCYNFLDSFSFLSALSSSDLLPFSSSSILSHTHSLHFLLPRSCSFYR